MYKEGNSVEDALNALPNVGSEFDASRTTFAARHIQVTRTTLASSAGTWNNIKLNGLFGTSGVK